MINKEQYIKLFKLIIKAYRYDIHDFVSLDFKSLNEENCMKTPMKIVQKIKELESFNKGVKDYKYELKNAKDDLKNIFGIDTKGMTKNVIFLKHQSELANSIYYYFILNRRPNE